MGTTAFHESPGLRQVASKQNGQESAEFRLGHGEFKRQVRLKLVVWARGVDTWQELLCWDETVCKFRRQQEASRARMKVGWSRAMAGREGTVDRPHGH